MISAIIFLIACAGLPTRAFPADTLLTQNPSPKPAAESCVPWWKTPEHIGETTSVCGSVFDIRHTEDATILHFGSLPNAFKAIIPKRAIKEVYVRLLVGAYSGRLKITGRIEAHDGGTAIRVTDR